jgi:hypothetical protein
MPIYQPARPAGRAMHAVEFSIGEQLDIQGRYGAAKYAYQALTEVKPNCRLRV